MPDAPDPMPHWIDDGHSREHLLIFTRYPSPGSTKTRLIPTLGAEGAAALHQQMVEHALWEARQWQRVAPAAGPTAGPPTQRAIAVWYTGGTPAQMATWLGNDLDYHPQGEGDLGDRLSQACQWAFATGAQSVLLMGTDCPGLDELILTTAQHHLQRHDLVLGPALDGGYYLMGLRRWIPELFQGIAWSTATVLTRTMAIAQRLRLRTHLLSPLSDVDYAADLVHWQQANRRISVIIPTRNEASSIAQTLARLQPARNVEVIVADGGSTDETVAIAQSCQATVLTTPPGRAQQMNHAAREATGDILLFLHADTQVPYRFDQWVRRALAESQRGAGAFELQIDDARLGLRLIENWVNWRSRLLAMPYGDQAIFLQADTFWACGGFPNQPLMEDYELMQRLRRRGERLVIIPIPVVTSARRWQRLGILRTTAINQAIVLAYRLGVSPQHLAQWYRLWKKY
jgi:uncharacterized protein